MNNLIIGILIGIIITIFLMKINEIICPSVHEIVKKLVRQSGRWLVASQQDKSPLISMLHAMYGWGYYMALKEFATDDMISDYVNPKEFEAQLNGALDSATQKVVSVCPTYASDLNLYFARVAGDI